MLPLPLHFLNTTIEGIIMSYTIPHISTMYFNDALFQIYHPPLLTLEREVMKANPLMKHVTFYSLKKRILSLLLRSFEHETDAVNMQLLLCGLLMVIQDHVTYENTYAETEAIAKDTAEQWCH